MELTYDPRLDRILRSLSKKDLARIIRVAELFKERSFSLSKLYLKKLARNLWELRAEKWRLLFGLSKIKAIAVNVFMKKSQKTPKKEIKLAIKRLQDYL